MVSPTLKRHIGDGVLENKNCRALFLTSHEVKPDDLQAWHFEVKGHWSSSISLFEEKAHCNY